MSNIAGGVEESVKLVAYDAKDATTRLVGHTYGADAEDVVNKTLEAGMVSLVYFDKYGVSRRTVVRNGGGDKEKEVLFEYDE